MLRDLRVASSCVPTQAAQTERQINIISIDIMSAITETVDRQITSERTVLSKVRVVMLTIINKKGQPFIIYKTNYNLKLKIKWERKLQLLKLNKSQWTTSLKMVSSQTRSRRPTAWPRPRFLSWKTPRSKIKSREQVRQRRANSTQPSTESLFSDKVLLAISQNSIKSRRTKPRKTTTSKNKMKTLTRRKLPKPT